MRLWDKLLLVFFYEIAVSYSTVPISGFQLMVKMTEPEKIGVFISLYQFFELIKLPRCEAKHLQQQNKSSVVFFVCLDVLCSLGAFIH